MKKYYLICFLLIAILLSGCSNDKYSNSSKDKNIAIDDKSENITAQPNDKNPEETIKEEKVLEQTNKPTQESIDYMKIIDMEKNIPYAGLKGDDYVRIISLDELADRVVATFKFIETYPTSPNKEEMTKWKNEYLHDYLFGNFKYTSSFQWMDGSNVFLQEFLKNYEDSKVKYKGTAFASLINDYTDLIKKEDNKMTDNVRTFVENHAKDEQVIFKLPT